MFGLTASAGSTVRSDPTDASEKIARLRLDLELVYNSVAGPSTDDSVDSHGSPHGTVRVGEGKGVGEKREGWDIGWGREKGRGAGDPGHATQKNKAVKLWALPAEVSASWTFTPTALFSEMP